MLFINDETKIYFITYVVIHYVFTKYVVHKL